MRLSSLITTKKGQQEKLEQGTILLENDFINALKVHIIVYITLQGLLDRSKQCVIKGGKTLLCSTVNMRNQEIWSFFVSLNFIRTYILLLYMIHHHYIVLVV